MGVVTHHSLALSRQGLFQLGRVREFATCAMAAGIDEPPPLLERAATALLHGLFGLGLIAREHRGPASGLRANSSTFGGLGFILATVIEAAQMLAFPLSHTQHVWHGTLVGQAMAQALTVVMPGSIDIWFGPIAYRVSRLRADHACTDCSGLRGHVRAAQGTAWRASRLSTGRFEFWALCRLANALIAMDDQLVQWEVDLRRTHLAN